MKRLLTLFVLLFLWQNASATVNYLGKTWNTNSTQLILWFNADPSFGQGLMAQLRYQVASTGSTNQFTGFVSGAFDNTDPTRPSGANWKVMIPLSATNTIVGGQIPVNATSIAVEGAKQGTFGNTGTGFEFTGFAWTISNPLPVTLTQFKGYQTGNAVELFWQTASEDNNDSFQIEKASNAINFEAIGSVKGAKNSTEKLNYTFIDEQAAEGTNYYRLKQIDFDGKFEYSRIIAVNFSKDGVFELMPNPTQDYVELKGIGKNATIKIRDAKGSTIQTLENQTDELKINLNNYQSGVYFIQITEPKGKNQTKKFIVK